MQSISDKLVSFITECDLPIDFFYKSLSVEELQHFRQESLDLNDHDTVKVVDTELNKRKLTLSNGE